MQSLVALPLLDEMERLKRKSSQGPIDIIIDLNLFYSGGQDPRALDAARERTFELIDFICEESIEGLGADKNKSRYGYQHVFARLEVRQIEQLAKEIETMTENDAPSEPD